MTKLNSYGVALLSVLAALGAAREADGQQVTADTAQVHVVRTGDTLWDLAGQYLDNPFLWPDIYTLNRGTVADPDLIFPEERIFIPGRLLAGAFPGVVVDTVPRAAPSRTVFYPLERTPENAVSTLRLTPPDEVPVVPVGAFLGAGRLVPDAEVAPVGQLVEVISPTIIPRSTQPQIQPYDQVYMVLQTTVGVGDRLHLFRADRVLEPHGRIYIATGTARVLAVDAGVATVEVDRFYDEVAIGDLALPMPEFNLEAGVTPEPATGLDGTLLAFEESQTVVATDDLGFLDLGSASGVVQGDEFVAYIPSAAADWGTRPEIPVARLQVIRTDRGTSTVRVLSLQQPALEPGLPVRLVARMPGR